MKVACITQRGGDGNVKDFVLEASDIVKSFSLNVVLNSVSFNLRRGEVHALAGENGSGKSTLMKIIMGIHQKDRGTIRLFGEEVAFDSPMQAIKHGIAMIHQELHPVMDMEISENIFMGKEIYKKPLYIVDKAKTRRKTRELLTQLGIDLDPSAKMRSLSVGQCQLVEIVKAISYDAKIVIMDEPTSAITEREVEILLGQIRRLREKGISIVYISHKMDEIFAISDRITVLRDGEYIGTHETKDLDSDRLITLMVGREISEITPKTNAPIGETVLKVDGLSYKHKFRDVNFELRRGEILGIAGLMGAGRSELVETIFGIRRKTSGTIEINKQPVDIKSPSDAIRHGMALITEDRKITGLNLSASIRDNITIVSIKKLIKYGLLNKKNEQMCAEEYIKKLKIKAKNTQFKTENLSGGNQQKVVVAKWLVGDPEIIIMDEPTRGIDVGAKRDIYILMGELVAQGKAIIMISSEMPEVMGMSDRIIVLSEGRVTGVFARGDFNQEKIMRCASDFGGISK
jgi:ABC-type sugar transport system ATPase subunit